MKRVFLVLLLLVYVASRLSCAALLAQDVGGNLKMTDSEKLKIKSKHIDLLSAQLNQRDLQSAVKQAEEAVKQAQKELQDSVNEVFAAHHVTPEDVTICSGPSPGICADAPKDDLILVPQPKSKDNK
jgi:uncharacterized protein YlxW (UPF0749 family)